MRILFTGGGTLGSVIPLLAVAELFVSEEMLWIGTYEGIERNFVINQGLPFQSIDSAKLRRYFSLNNIFILPNLLRGISQAKKIIQNFKPDIMVAAGGYVSVPVGFACKKLGVPYILLQLDIHPSLSNRVLQSSAKAICLSMPELKKYFTKCPTVVTGIPIAPSFISRATSPLQTFKHDAASILIMGGGTGSAWLNQFVVEKNASLLSRADIAHIQGSNERAVRIPSHNSQMHTYRSFSQVSREELADLYAQSKIVCARAGMGTFAELSELRKVSVIIPMPNSHQEQNAAYFAERNGCIVVSQSQGFDVLLEVLLQFLDTKISKDMANNIHQSLPHNAALQVADCIHQNII